MEIQFDWQKPILVAQYKKLIDDPDNILKIQNKPGIYFFSRRHGSTHLPFYIGDTLTLRNRFIRHLKNADLRDVLRSMKVNGFPEIRQGARYFHFAYLRAKPGQATKKCIKLGEKFLIEHALSEGYTLLNKKLTKIGTHSIFLGGSNLGRASYPTTGATRT